VRERQKEKKLDLDEIRGLRNDDDRPWRPHGRDYSLSDDEDGALAGREGNQRQRVELHST